MVKNNTVYVIKEITDSVLDDVFSETLHSIYTTREVAEKNKLQLESERTCPDDTSFVVEAWGVLDE